MDNLENTIMGYKPIEVSEIPKIDLYMDQVLSFLFDRIKDFRSDEQDKIMTKTMVNNYVKSKLIMQPSKKKYNLNHIKDLIMIYHFKNVISIKQINHLFKIYVSENKENNLYDVFLDIQKEELLKIQTPSSNPTPDPKDHNKLRIIVRNLIQADIHSRIAEANLTDYNIIVE